MILIITNFRIKSSEVTNFFARREISQRDFAINVFVKGQLICIVR